MIRTAAIAALLILCLSVGWGMIDVFLLRLDPFTSTMASIFIGVPIGLFAVWMVT